MADRTEYRDQVVRLTDLVVTSEALAGADFINCEVVGPAVLLIGGATVTDCTFEAPTPDSLFWTIEDGRDEIVGAIGLIDVSFTACRFRRVGLAALASQMAAIRGGFGL